MARSLAAFFGHLVTSDEHLNTFLTANDDEKKKLMKKFGLSPRQYNAVMSGDLAKILTVLNDEDGPKPGDFLLP